MTSGMTTMFRRHWRELIGIGVPLVLYICVTIPLRHWIVDDAGITFAYARSLALGNGLVSQPGLLPVEGYSNTLWLLLLTPFFLFDLFHPYIVPKLLGLFMVGFAYWALYRSIVHTTGQHLVALVALSAISINVSFAVWTCSGLENSLLVALLAILAWQLIEYSCRSEPALRHTIAVGLTAVGIALTRPDGVIYMLLFPVLVLTNFAGSTNASFSGRLTRLAQYVGSVLLLYGGFLLFRFLYFGRWLPNTYYAKGGPSSGDLWSAMTLRGQYLEKCQQLLESVFGSNLWYLIPCFMLIVAVPWLKTNIRTRVPWILMTLTSYAAFMLLPSDWMREYRFATPFIVFIYVLIALMGSHLITTLVKNVRVRTIIGLAAVVVFVGASFINQLPRYRAFYKWPVVPFSVVAKEYAYRFNRYADELGISGGSVLLPDVGGALYYSKLRIIDLGGLCDTTIARTLAKNQREFYDYVFDEVRPTFIHIHGAWTARANLDADPRFRSDYKPIIEYKDKWVLRRRGKEMMSGNYVRRDAVEGKDEILMRLAEE